MNTKYVNKYMSVGIALLLFAVIFLPYYFTFKEFGIIQNTTTWAEYGNYISGIAGVLNLIVFIFLTIYVAKLGNTNSKTQILTQKKIIISQFRQTVLEKLDEQLDQVIHTNGKEDKELTLSRYSNAGVILTNFLNQKKYLFPILDDTEIITLGINIINKISEFIDMINEVHGNPDIGNSMDNILSNKIQATAFLKNELIEKLQLFILNELEK